MSRAETSLVQDRVREAVLDRIVKEALARAPRGTSVSGDWLMALAEAVWETAKSGPPPSGPLAVERDDARARLRAAVSYMDHVKVHLIRHGMFDMVRGLEAAMEPPVAMELWIAERDRVRMKVEGLRSAEKIMEEGQVVSSDLMHLILKKIRAKIDEMEASIQ